MQEYVDKLAPGSDAVVMAAAVADFRPAELSATKLKKGSADEPSSVSLVRNPDILAALGAQKRAGRVVVGFAAETDEVLANGRAKLAAKGADLLVVNHVGDGRGFDSADNEAVILDAAGGELSVPFGPKEALANAVWDAVVARLSTAPIQEVVPPPR
jgi:phosphopantothenoylcysteine decarboxylase/phosphopantothenate--cysteine ligase